MPTALDAFKMIVDASRGAQDGSALQYYSTLSPGRRAAIHQAFQAQSGPGGATGGDYLLNPQQFIEFLRTPGALRAAQNRGFAPGVTPNQSPHLQNYDWTGAASRAALGRQLAGAQEARAAALFNADTLPLLRQGALLNSGPFPTPTPAPSSAPPISGGFVPAGTLPGQPTLTAPPPPVPQTSLPVGFGHHAGVSSPLAASLASTRAAGLARHGGRAFTPGGLGLGGNPNRGLRYR